MKKQKEQKGNPITAERIRKIRNQHRNDTQEVIAEYLGYSVVQYGRIERGEAAIKEGKLERLANRWNIAVQYFTGEENEPLTPLQYAAKQDLIHARDIAVDDLWRSVQDNDRLRAILFSACGYEYEHECIGPVDFAPFASSADEVNAISPDGGRHLIRPIDDTGAEWTAFTEAELHALIDRLKNTIAFEIFVKGREAHHGDD